MRLFYTTYEAAHLLGVSLPTVVNWIKARRIKAHRTPGGHRRIAREDLAAFMLRHGMDLPPELSDAAHVRRRALVITATGALRDALASQLSQAGYMVALATPGFAAGAAAARHEPDLVVIEAPSPDGGELLQALRADPHTSDVPIVAISATEWFPRLRAAGCDGTVAGPLVDGTLLRAAAEAMSLANTALRRRR